MRGESTKSNSRKGNTSLNERQNSANRKNSSGGGGNLNNTAQVSGIYAGLKGFSNNMIRGAGPYGQSLPGSAVNSPKVAGNSIGFNKN